LDPAMPLRKLQAYLKTVYGFDCACELCRCQSRSGIPSMTASGALREALEADLQAFGDEEAPSFDNDYTRLPPDLLGAFNESFLREISESFSQGSHDGPFLAAVRFGQILRGIYRIIYPPLYPLLGYHDLELAKTVWNAIAENEVQAEEDRFKSKALRYLQSAEVVLEAVGQADKDTGWDLEVNQLKAVLAQTGTGVAT